MLSAFLWILNAARYTFFVIFVVAVSFLSLNSVIGNVRDFLVAQNTSIFGISLLVYMLAVFILGSIVIFPLVTYTTSNICVNSIHLRIPHIVSLATCSGAH